MTDIALEMHHVSKKFRRGQLHDSLRDAIPALVRRLVKGRSPDALQSREFWAVRDVSFQVRRGEAFGVIGPNGAGKSTILKLLSGIMRPTQGTLSVRGRLSALIEVSAGFHGDLTGRENIFLNGTIIGMARQEIARRYDEIVAFSGLEEFIDTPVKRYSSGMWARLGFAVAAHMDPDILIVDEVLSVGDYVFQQKCIERMTSIIRGGATVIFVSHNLRAVAELCDRVLLLDHGQSAAIGRGDEVIRTYLERVETDRTTRRQAGVFVSRAVPGTIAAPRVHFTSGERMTVEVEVVSRQKFDRLALILGFRDEREYTVFYASSEQLVGKAFGLAPDQAITCTFELDLHLAPGRYRVCTWVVRAGSGHHLDHWPVAATIFVSHPQEVRGVVHLYPRAVLGPPHAAPADTADPGRAEPGASEIAPALPAAAS